MSSRDYESVRNFIRHRFEEVIRNQEESQAQQAMKPVTVRLPQGTIALADLLAQELDLNRQEFLSQLITEALQEAIQTMVEFSPQDQKQQAIKHYLDVMTGAVEGQNDE